MKYEYDHFNSFSEFFTREVKERYIDPDTNRLVAPADSYIVSITEVKGDENLLIKNVNYSMGEFLTGVRNYKI